MTIPCLSSLDKQTLIHIASHSGLELPLRYEAARELQHRHIPEEDQADILRLAGTGTNHIEIADELGLSVEEVKRFIRNMHRRHKTEDSWKIGYKKTLKNVGRKLYGKIS